MNCKFCFAELPEDVTVCPACGKDQAEEVETTAEETVEVPAEETEDILVAEETPAKKKKMPKALTVTLAVLGGLVLAAALAFAVLYGMGYKLSNIGAFLGLKEAGIDYKNNYTVSDQKVEKKADEVVAKVGDQTLTNEQLQVYYWLTVQDYVYQYEYAISLGQDLELEFDLKKPLSEQVYDAKTGQTYEQFFLENAIESWRRYATFVQLAQDSNYAQTEEIRDFLDNYKEDLEEAAKAEDYADAEAMIDDLISKGSSVDAYYNYVWTQYTALGYLQSKEEDLAPTEQEMEDYYKAHEDELKEAGYGKSDGKYYDVRHIFVTVEGEKGEKGYTDAQWEACRAKAQKLLDDFLANEPTEEKFAQLAIKNSKDPGSASNGGLYANLTKNYGFIKEFENWYVDEGRKPGDTGLVKNTGSSQVGYHVMYFSGSRDIWKDQTETLMLADRMGELLEQTKAKYPMTVNYKKVALGKADLATEEQ